MTAKQLTEIGERLVKRCGTRDPFEIARQLGAEVLFCPDFGSMKGMYRVVKRNRFIFLNRDLTPQMQRIVCAHVQRIVCAHETSQAKSRTNNTLLTPKSAQQSGSRHLT